MKKKKNILVFPCGSEIGLAIHDCLKYSTYFNLIGLSSVQDHGSFVYEVYIGGAPIIKSEEIIPFLNKIIEEYDIDAIYPAMDMVSTVLKRNEADLKCKIISSCVETSETCLSKEKTYDKLQSVVPIPIRYSPDQVSEFPLFVKPKIGYGARGTKLINDKKELDAVKNDPDLLFLEYLPGREYTVDCFTDRHGNLQFCRGRERQRIKSGISVHTSYLPEDPKILSIAREISAQLSFDGAWFFQLKEDRKGNPKLLEIADRIGGSSLLAKALGVNLPLLTLFNAFGFDVKVNPGNYSVQLDRALSNSYKCEFKYDKVYVDFDDCLVIDDRDVNYELVSFLYKCINQKKKLVLLTKHKRDIHESLNKFRLSNLFDEIIHLDESQNKADFIDSINSIFIDDSFSERERLKEVHDIPVFGPEMVNVLM